jgi:hypothetical protein
MPIEFRCIQCGKLLRTGDDTAGKPAKCPNCGTITTIPDSSISSVAGQAATDSIAPLQSGCPFAAVGTYQPSGPITPSTLDTSDVFSRTWTIFKPNWGMCLIVLVLVFLMNFAANFIGGIIPFVGGLMAAIFNVWIGVGQAIFFLKTVRGQQAELSDLFTGWPYFVRVFFAGLLVGLIIFGIAVVCVLPLALIGAAISEEAAAALGIAGGIIALPIAIYVLLGLSQYYYLIIDRNLGITESLSTSRVLMDGNKVTLLVINLLCFLIAIVAILPCGLGLLVVGPYFALMYPMIYLIVTGQPTADQMQVRTPTQM